MKVSEIEIDVLSQMTLRSVYMYFVIHVKLILSVSHFMLTYHTLEMCLPHRRLRVRHGWTLQNVLMTSLFYVMTLPFKF